MRVSFASVMLYLSGLRACTNMVEAEMHETRKAEGWTLSGRPLYPPIFTGDQNQSLEIQLQIARNNLAIDACTETPHDQHDPAKVIWLARRLGYSWKYLEALQVRPFLRPITARLIATISSGLTFQVLRDETRVKMSTTHQAALGRHLGHRLITVRNFTAASTTLGAAATLVSNGTAVPNPDAWEEDGEPNEANVPLSTLSFNTHYHHALALYLSGRFVEALEANTACLAASHINDESITASLYWRWMLLTRLGRKDEAASSLAPIHFGMRTLEGASYLNLTLLFKGELQVRDILPEWRAASPLDLATLGYGVGFWYYFGPGANRTEGIEVWTATADPDRSPYWPAFGFVAAEAELYRLGSLM